jgi:protein-L-isoaspartate(D-aspartate) O-methyltransferase
MVAAIRKQGELADARWRAAFESVPREVFVPEFLRPEGDGGASAHLTLRADDPDPRRRADWLASAYADTALVTQVSPGHGPVSSSSQPSLMAMMLRLLSLRDGDRVLEIGTGTGYNAALLAHRLGGESVVTVDLEESITGPARSRLAEAGYGGVRVVTGDGAGGWPPGAPYDAVVATCAVPAVPPEWPAQMRPGGLIVTPLGTGLLRLRVGQNATAEGRFLPTGAYFVPLRGPAAASAGAARAVAAAAGARECEEPEEPAQGRAMRGAGSPTRSDIPLGPGIEPFTFLLRFALADAELTLSHRRRPQEFSAMVAAGDGSIAHLAPDGRVTRSGPRDVWGEVERLYARWVEWGRPDRDRFGVTVRPDRQWIWLDRPAGGPWQRDLSW